MALTGLDDLVSRTSSSSTSEHFYFHKSMTFNGSTTDMGTLWNSTFWHSMWTWDGIPTTAAIPTTVANPDRTTTGALGQANAGSGSRYIYNLAIMTPVPGEIMVYDRLLHIGGLSATNTSAQTVGGTLSRNTGGANNAIMWEAYTTIGSTLVTITGSYTNQAGTSGRTTLAKSMINVTQGAMGFLPLASGDTGVRAVANVTLSATRGTAGNFGITILRPLGVVACTEARNGGFVGVGNGWLAPVEADSCIAFLFRPWTSLSGASNTKGYYVHGALGLVEA